ncbi:cytochrome P450 4C1 [Ooceraea biroi]|uniref:cytochrome P450 4C1 n=1 Tax=Ooceraea biroi TaxID=2015173 RepID=UPI000F07981F|nr:cytochrome P450 4C1 [Ooceraea biroi]
MILILLLSVIVVLFVWNYYVHYGSRKGRLINRIPGPAPVFPIGGNVLEYQQSHEALWKLLRYETDFYYPIIKIWCFFVPVVSIRHPDDLKIVLSPMKHLEKSAIYDILLSWFNTGLLTSAGDKWHARRKILTPAFHFNILRQFVDILIEEGEQMTKSLKDGKGAVEEDLIPFLSEYTLNAICETAMGTSLKGLGAFQKKYRQAVHKMGLLLVYRLVRPWLHPILFGGLLFDISPPGFLQRKLLRILQGFTDKIIAERKLYHERTGDRYLKIFENDKMTEEDNTYIGTRKKRLAMLDLLIAASRENHITDFDIREEVDTFMFAGHEPTAVGICYLLLLLAEHKDIQDRIRAEVDSVMQEDGERFTLAMLQKLPYLDRCLKESMRLYPSVHFISRLISEDVTFQKKYVVPAGTVVHLNIYGVHRDPNFWPNPEVFDPDRFLPERSQNHHPYSYLPFSAGPRNCLGKSRTFSFTYE